MLRIIDPTKVISTRSIIVISTSFNLKYHQEEPTEVEKVINLVARVRAIMEYSV